ncbi:hypothetical protein COT63_00485 [Candidatus Shapirobacteria bacterium CG09_land_8_20_14_0_10_38_17]|uniref:O-antigen ligase-related domain-containing protein n=1 Tax=Candidatus Shapirobacteria bacterium CG09_land_8_20_14_0_10_38_17 TaxID=1974884 RepID=A0A2H0WRQ1_9BACT|nr:MAG: hypothetical protein COT63_00485 [Candidatus Shapirobacteria bacterium CG09_land_8_20_14_0_10_38_17]
MPKKIGSLAQKIIESSFYLLFFLTPLFLTTVNYELFEFNKMLLAYGLATIILSAWIVKIILQKKIIFQKTPLFWPLLLFLGSQIAATIYSIDLHTSIFGYYTRLNGGLLSIITYLILYFAFTSNINQAHPKFIHRCLTALTAAAFLVCSYGILEHFGIDDQYWVQDVKTRVFSTLGQPNWLAAWIDCLIFLPIVGFLNSLAKNSKKISIIYYLLSIILYTCLLFTGSRSGFLALIITYPFFWLITFILLKNRKQLLKPFLITTISFSLLTFFFTPPIKSISLFNLSQLTQFDSPNINLEKPAIYPKISTSEDIRKVVWKGAIALGKKYPILGTGVETFAYSYYWTRPQEHNLLSEWDFLYNKAHNEYLNYFATTGILGLGSYLFLIVFFIFWNIKILKSRLPSIHYTLYSILIHIALFSGWLTILITNFFGFSVVAVNLLFFLIPAIIYTITNHKQPTINNTKFPEKLSTRQTVGLILVFPFILYTLYFILSYWSADYHFNKAEKFQKQSQYSLAYQEYQQAMQKNPQEPLYKNNAATNLAYLSLLATQQEEASSAAQFALQSEELAQKALLENPYHLDFYRQYAQTLYALSPIDSHQYFEKIKTALYAAQKLAPTDPKITYNLGVIEYKLDNQEQATNWLEKTIAMKPDYEIARLWLAKFYQAKEQNQKAQEQLEYLLKYINPDNQEAKEMLNIN